MSCEALEEALQAAAERASWVSHSVTHPIPAPQSTSSLYPAPLDELVAEPVTDHILCEQHQSSISVRSLGQSWFSECMRTHPVLLGQGGNHRSGKVLDEVAAEEAEVLEATTR